MEQSYWSIGVNWTEGPLDEGREPRRWKVRYFLHGISLERSTIGPNPVMKLEGEHMFWRIVCKVQGFKGGSCSRVQFASNCFKFVHMFLKYGPQYKVPLRAHFTLEKLERSKFTLDLDT